jgi:hypothetical protein
VTGGATSVGEAGGRQNSCCVSWTTSDMLHLRLRFYGKLNAKASSFLGGFVS